MSPKLAQLIVKYREAHAWSLSCNEASRKAQRDISDGYEDRSWEARQIAQIAWDACVDAGDAVLRQIREGS